MKLNQLIKLKLYRFCRENIQQFENFHSLRICTFFFFFHPNRNFLHFVCFGGDACHCHPFPLYFFLMLRRLSRMSNLGKLATAAAKMSTAAESPENGASVTTGTSETTAESNTTTTKTTTKTTNTTTTRAEASAAPNTTKGADGCGEIDMDKYDLLKEGTTTILFPKNHVFYNPVQQYNRDLSSLAIRTFGKRLSAERTLKRSRKGEKATDDRPFMHLLEALSASGLRAIRYSKEVPLLEKVVANDLSKDAVRSIQLNIDYNGAKNVVAQHSNAITHMATHGDEYHIIDLDPYGTVAPFVDSALNAVKNGGLLLITCTDLGVLAGNGYPEKCYSLYGGVNVWGDATHESALRLVLGLVARSGGKYGIAIEPLLSLSIDFYVRVFVRVWRKPVKVKELMSANTLVAKCSGCHSSVMQRMGKMESLDNGGKSRTKYGLAKVEQEFTAQCVHCGFSNHICGPMWGGKLHNKEFVEEMLQELEQTSGGKEGDVEYGTIERMRGMLTMAHQEIEAPLYFNVSTLSSVLKIPVPTMEEVVSALGNGGYDVSLTHAAPSCIKTNAPWPFIWQIGRALAQRSGLDSSRLSTGTAGYRILNGAEDVRDVKDDKDIQEVQDIDFTENAVTKRVRKLRSMKIRRHQVNPTKNWGPKARPS